MNSRRVNPVRHHKHLLAELPERDPRGSQGPSNNFNVEFRSPQRHGVSVIMIGETQYRCLHRRDFGVEVNHDKPHNSHPGYTKYGGEMPWEFWTTGKIISCHIHHADYRKPEDPQPDNNRTLANCGSWVYSKLRKLIVIKSYEHHFIAVPLYTHSGTGLANYVNSKNEFVGIRDSALRQQILKYNCRKSAII